MEITARVTADAQVRKLKDGRELVTFSVAINDSYKGKSGNWEEKSTVISCSYWISTKVAAVLRKGSIVTVTGSIGINAYKSNDGEFHANLTFHCDRIKVIASGKGAEATQPATVATTNSGNNDLPF